MRKLFFFLALISLVSCEEKQETPEAPEIKHETSFSDRLEVNATRTVDLSPEARQIAGEWLEYATAQNEIQNLRNSTGLEIMNSSRNLVQIMESLQETIPDSLESIAVETRSKVLFTKAKMLQQLSKKKQKNPDEIFEVANDLVVEFDNFKLQLNELFLKTPENFEMQLDEAYQDALEPDSTGTIPLFRTGGI